MGTSLIQGWLRKATKIDDASFKWSVCCRSDESLSRFKHAVCEYDTHSEVNASTHYTQIAHQADIVIIAVPPTELETVLRIDGLILALRSKIIVSLLAGVSCEQIAQAISKMDNDNGAKVDGRIPEKYCIVRAMPSIAAKECESVTLMSAAPAMPKETLTLCTGLFSQVGSTIMVSEQLMDEATALGAVCHALVVSSADALVDAGVGEGLPRQLGLAIASQSLRSAAGLIASGTSIEELKSSVSIPKSITIRSLLQFERGNIRGCVADTVKYATSYTKKMAS